MSPVSRRPLPLPLHRRWASAEEYIESLLKFITTSDLFKQLCGGVHVLDFLTREPDIYSYILPEEWRQWVEAVDIHDFLDLLLREDLAQFDDHHSLARSDTSSGWRGYLAPPQGLIEYIDAIRVHSLLREYSPAQKDISNLPHHVSVGMNTKKVHEVKNFAAYVDQLAVSLAESTNTPHLIVDFGSGQNYLGRTLASPPYNKTVVAIEQRRHNIKGAREMDVHAKLAEKEKIIRNKKEYKRQLTAAKNSENILDQPHEHLLEQKRSGALTEPKEVARPDPAANTAPDVTNQTEPAESVAKGPITYVEHALESGNIEHIVKPSQSSSILEQGYTDTKLCVVSIHSCGNLTHHGLRAITLNPSVQAVAMIGCCYNLLTERLGPVTYKHPQLRSKHPRVERLGLAYDSHGFPMSKRFEDYEYVLDTAGDGRTHERSIKLNITARMMAVQAPYNWGREDSEMFFTRHFYRALLQRMLFDYGVLNQRASSERARAAQDVAGGSYSESTPLIVGSLRKSAFASFPAYVQAALEKLTVGNANSVEGDRIASKTNHLRSQPELIFEYEQKYAYARKHLAVIWSLMAFSAGVVESTIVTDRWLWLTEQPEVEDAWVEAVFDYKASPRNLCVVGIKKQGDAQDTTTLSTPTAS